MRAYFAIFKIRMKVLLQYRSAAFAGICAQIFWAFLHVMVLKAFYLGSMETSFSVEKAIAFIWISQAFISFLPSSIYKKI